jgi:hypothetical protein
MLQLSLSETFSALNVAMPNSIGGFRALVEGIDRTTIEGQRLFAALLEISPAFADYVDQLKDANDSMVDAAYSALQRSVKAEKEIINDQVGILNSALSASKSVYSALDNSLRGMVISSNPSLEATRAGAQDQLQGFLSGAKSGTLPAIDKLNSALSVISKPSEFLYSTFEDYAFDMARTAATIKELRDITGDQISDEEKALQELKNQSEYLDEMVGYAKEQIDILNGVDVSVIGLVDAMNNFASVVGVQLPAIQQLSPEQLSAMNTRQGETVAEKMEQASVKQQAQMKEMADYVKAALLAIADSTDKTKKVLEKFDTIGMPPVRED